MQVAGVDSQLLLDAFNASPIGMVLENLEGQPIFVNPAFCSMLGFSEEELQAKHCVDFSPPEDAQKDWALFQQLRTGEIDHYQLEKRYFRRDGSVVWGRLTISLLNSRPSPLIVAMVEDITDKKKAEDSRLRHAAVIESSEDAIISKNLDAVIVSWNAAAQRMFGYTEQEAVGQPITLLIPPELHDEEQEILDRLRVGGRIEHYETKRITKTGKEIDVSLTIGPIRDSVGNVVGFSKIAHDITGRKRAEAAIRSSEERLRLAQHAARIGTFERNPQTGVITWTPEMESLYGLKPGGFGQTLEAFQNLIHPDDRERVNQLMEQARETGHLTIGEWRAVWPDGSVHWIGGRWQTLMSDSGKPVRVIGVNVDISQRKEAEAAVVEANRALETQAAALQSREELLKIFVKNVPAGVAMLDRDMRYLQVSDRFCADYGVNSSQVLGRSHYELFPDVPERWKEVHRRAFAGETVRAEEDPWERQDGTTRWVRWEIRPWRTEGGNIGGILILAEDITRGKQMEEALSVMSRKLIESQEQERARIGRELHDDISQKLAMLAIDLDRLGEAPADSRKSLQELRNDIEQISHDVQALSHELHSSKLEYLGVVSTMKSWCREFGERQRMEINFSSETESTLSFEVGLSLFRVLQEALHNTVKHSGVKRVEVQLAEHSGEIHLTIHDSGIGFDVEAARQGRGLGLTSMQERARLLNGSVSVESRSMQGTTIHVRVPLKAENAGQ